MTLIELMQQKADAIKQMRALLDKADAEKRDITADETAEYEKLERTVTDLDGKIGRAEKLEKLESDVAKPANPLYRPAAPAIVGRAQNDEEFSGLGEFVYAIRFNQNDKRLQAVEQRDMSVQDGSGGGFMVPKQLSSTLLSVSPQEAIVRPRATIIPAGSPPDASIDMPALDQKAANGMYGGVSFAWTAEGGTKNATDIDLKMVTMQPREASGYIVVTDKLLRNWTAANSFIGNQLRKAMIGWEDSQFLSANGVAKPKGVLNQKSAITYSRATASQIAYADVLGMYARAKFGGSLVWVGSQTILPQLGTIKGGNNENIWIPNAAGNVPGSLLGIPLIFNERAPALGTAGDLMLCDFSYYLIKEGSGPFIDASPHVYFTSNKTVIKIFWNVDADSWLTEPLYLEGSTTSTISPFVILGA